MSASQLYIPKRINVGYQSRSGTYTGKLSYIIYWDDKGVLRKETSWQGWRDKKIPAEEFDNVPTTGFVLHKDIKRYNWSHFSSKRTLIRIWDPRGMEFEITTENLLGILMSDDCCKRQLVGSYVYAWSGPELVLLPTCSEEYQKATTYTNLQSKKVSAKTLVIGAAYKTKKEKDVVYLGRLPWHDWKALKGEEKSGYHGYPHQRFSKVSHIFTPVAKKAKDDYYFEQWIIKSDASFLGEQLTEQPVEDLADRIEAFQKDTHSAAIVRWEVVPVEVSEEVNKDQYDTGRLKRTIYWSMDGDVLTRWQLDIRHEGRHDPVTREWKQHFKHYDLSEGEKLCVSKQTTIIPPRDTSGWGYSSSRINLHLQPSQLQGRGLGDLYITFETGRRMRVPEATYFTSL